VEIYLFKIARRFFAFIKSRVVSFVPIEILCCCTLCLNASAQTNSWTNAASANWEDPEWSLGVLPGTNQTVYLTNAGWKAVEIGENTTQNYPQSLCVSSMAISSPTDSFNELLMNYAGWAVPLSADSMSVGSNCAVVMDYSSLYVTNELTVDGEFTQDVSSVVMTESGVELGVEAPGTYTLASGLISAANSNSVTEETIGVNFPSQFIQQDGTNQMGYVNIMPGSEYDLNGGILDAAVFLSGGGTEFIDGTFNQQGGTNTGSVDMETTNGNYELFGGAVQGNVILRAGTFQQRGGTNSAGLITGWRGEYDLAGGVLSPGDLVVGSPPQNFLQFAGGGIEQTGGTNDAGDISMVFGFYDLRGGTLSARSLTLTTNTLLGGLYAGFFNQYGGYQTNGGITMIGGRDSYSNVVTASYTLNGGTLETPFITMNLAGFNHHLGTNRVGTISMSNTSTYVMNGGLLVVDEIQVGSNAAFYHSDGGSLAGTRNVILANGGWVEQGLAVQLGQLQLSSGTNSFLTLSGLCVLQFADSSGVPWSSDGRLTIKNWSGWLYGGGRQQLIFGNSQTALTPQQLTEIQFQNPAGLPAGTYPARILADGEVVPDSGSPLPFELGLATIQSDGSFQLLIQGDIGQTYEIDASTDLQHWVPLSTLTNNTGTVSFSDNGASNYSQRFYRAHSSQ